VVEIYLPDLKYGDDANAEACSGAKDYWATATAAVREMSRQVGRLHLDADGLATRGLIVRHLVLPGGLAGTGRVLDWIAGNLPVGTKVSLMGQYFPAGGGPLAPPLHRRLDPEEYADACALLDRYPEIDGWTQDMSLPGSC
jgi:putative pyruvate formate lyase activating enzyme